mmetsp:Transcript_14840/g.40599  ORF Transcript_14840/g.40599 Transcript_14840/m.40599 type:complete len:151 (+) Transcript_14840:2-454(+)
MWVRDDAYWVGDMPRPSALMKGPEASRTLWSLRDGKWGGLNDRIVMFGRDAAPALLTLFSGFMRGGFPNGSSNAESHLLAAARHGHVVLQYSTFEELPCAMAMTYDAQQGPALCIIRMYWYGHAAGVPGLTFCEDVEKTTTPRPNRRSKA